MSGRLVSKTPHEFNPRRDRSKSNYFGARTHFCAGASASKALIVDVAIPMLVEAFSALTLRGEVIFNGWVFRSPLVPVEWKN